MWGFRTWYQNVSVNAEIEWTLMIEEIQETVQSIKSRQTQEVNHKSFANNSKKHNTKTDLRWVDFLNLRTILQKIRRKAMRKIQTWTALHSYKQIWTPNPCLNSDSSPVPLNPTSKCCVLFYKIYFCVSIFYFYKTHLMFVMIAFINVGPPWMWVCVIIIFHDE